MLVGVVGIEDDGDGYPALVRYVGGREIGMSNIGC